MSFLCCMDSYVTFFIRAQKGFKYLTRTLAWNAAPSSAGVKEEPRQ